MSLKPWRIAWGEEEWTDADASGAHLAIVADQVPGWEATSPWSSPAALVAWLIALIATTKPGTPAERIAAARVEVWTSPRGEVLDALHERPPLEQ